MAKSDERTYEEREADGRAALQAALAAVFAVQRLEAHGTLYLYGSAAPTLVLWSNAWNRLPELMTWLAAMAWIFSVLMAFTLGAIALTRRVQLAHASPEAGRVARLHFLPAEDRVPRGSTILVGLATAAAAVLCVFALAPPLPRADVVQVARKTWMLLFAGALGCRYLESRSGETGG